MSIWVYEFIGLVASATAPYFRFKEIVDVVGNNLSPITP